jgi:hypothetical protein
MPKSQLKAPRPGEYMRKVVFRPFNRESQLPRFELFLLAYKTPNNPFGAFGSAVVSYRFDQITADGERSIITTGEDFRPGASMSVDGDQAVESLMGFITLREHDTDRETFERQVSTPQHLEFSQLYAEAVSAEVSARFSCYDCGGTGRDLKTTRTRDGYVRVCAYHAQGGR